jgi:hypothetical protein
MKKMKKVFFIGAFALTLVSSFAFKVEKKRFFQQCSAWDPLVPWGQCDNGMLTDDDCTIYNEGAQCTAEFDYGGGAIYYQPAYSPGGGSPACFYPMNHQF